ncbi:MAG: DUF790 family protein, partial [Thermoplasmata archaeon]
PENTDYVNSVISLFESSIGLPRMEIEKKIRELEYTGNNPKIIRAIALVVSRNSKFEASGTLPPEEVRDFIFRYGPTITYEDRNEVLAKAAENFKVSVQDVENSIYSDLEDNMILKEINMKDPVAITKEFNAQELETLLVKSTKINVSIEGDWYRLISAIKRNGLVFEAFETPVKSVIIDGPDSMFRNMERYGSDIAKLSRTIINYSGWKMEADIRIKEKKYRMILDDSVSYYLPESRESDGPKVPDPVYVDHRMFFPSTIIDIGGEKIYVDIVRYGDPEKIRERDAIINKNGIKWLSVFLGDFKLKGDLVFRNMINWDTVKAVAMKKFRSDKPKQTYELSSEDIEVIRRDVDKLFPDSSAILSYLEGNMLRPERILKELGYRIKWNGLDPVIVKS